MRNISELVGKTLTECRNNNDEEIIFVCETGESYKLYHSQNCCENVLIDDINGDLNDLIGSPITMAEEVSNEEFEKQWESEFTEREGRFYPESHTWTFYKLATVKGYVNIRWYGESNGYYSESVSFVKKEKGEREW